MANDTSSVTQLITSFRAITQRDAITPDSLGYLLQRILEAASAQGGDGIGDLHLLRHNGTDSLYLLTDNGLSVEFPLATAEGCGLMPAEAVTSLESCRQFAEHMTEMDLRPPMALPDNFVYTSDLDIDSIPESLYDKVTFADGQFIYILGEDDWESDDIEVIEGQFYYTATELYFICNGQLRRVFSEANTVERKQVAQMIAQSGGTSASVDTITNAEIDDIMGSGSLPPNDGSASITPDELDSLISNLIL